MKVAMKLDDYKVVLYRNQPDGWVAEVPSIPGCYALMPTKLPRRFRNSKESST